MKLKDQNTAWKEIPSRLLHQLEDQDLERVFSETYYEELKRLEKYSHSPENQAHRQFYQHLAITFFKENISGQKAVLEKIIRFYLKEVMGNFSAQTYAVATKIVPLGLNLLLNALSPLKLINDLPHGFKSLENHITLLGKIQSLKNLNQKGTLILVPTHSSNLDSLLVGYSLFKLGLPPFLYGAGLNLFKNKLMGFFMDRLGAYKVDRLKSAWLYKEVLKAYAQFTMELGYPNLFFSGGTRSRSGMVEPKLKLGLLGMGLKAYENNLKNKKAQPDIFIIPCTLNYQWILEAPTLIEDYLKNVGKSHYIIEDDESFQPKKILEWMIKLFKLEARLHVVFGQARDPFGNPVNDQGDSLDPRGRVVDRKAYLMKGGKLHTDPQRDEEYTKELGQKLVASFQTCSLFSPIHLVSFVVWQWLRQVNPHLDTYHLLRNGGKQAWMQLNLAYHQLIKLNKKLRALEKQGQLYLDPLLKKDDPVLWMNQALRLLKSYPAEAVLSREGDRLYHHRRELLFYYQNRLAHLKMLKFDD